MKIRQNGHEEPHKSLPFKRTTTSASCNSQINVLVNPKKRMPEHRQSPGLPENSCQCFMCKLKVDLPEGIEERNIQRISRSQYHLILNSPITCSYLLLEAQLHQENLMSVGYRQKCFPSHRSPWLIDARKKNERTNTTIL